MKLSLSSLVTGTTKIDTSQIILKLRQNQLELDRTESSALSALDKDTETYKQYREASSTITLLNAHPVTTGTLHLLDGHKDLSSVMEWENIPMVDDTNRTDVTKAVCERLGNVAKKLWKFMVKSVDQLVNIVRKSFKTISGFTRGLDRSISGYNRELEDKYKDIVKIAPTMAIDESSLETYQEVTPMELPSIYRGLRWSEPYSDGKERHLSNEVTLLNATVLALKTKAEECIQTLEKRSALVAEVIPKVESYLKKQDPMLYEIIEFVNVGYTNSPVCNIELFSQKLNFSKIFGNSKFVTLGKSLIDTYNVVEELFKLNERIDKEGQNLQQQMLRLNYLPRIADKNDDGVDVDDQEELVSHVLSEMVHIHLNDTIRFQIRTSRAIAEWLSIYSTMQQLVLFMYTKIMEQKQ